MAHATEWVHDPSHPKHPLKQVYKNTSFRCGLCRTNGKGTRLRCDSCDFNLHEACSALPPTLPTDFFAHRRHPLHLKPSKPRLLSFRRPDCLLCGHSIRGASFKCKECSVYLHPLCARLPERVPAHAVHPLHPLRLEERRAAGECDVCGEECRKWRYWCGVCDVSIHIKCLGKGMEGVRAREAAEEMAKGELLGVMGDIFGQFVEASLDCESS